MHRYRLLYLFVCCIVGIIAHAQQRTPDIHYTHRLFTTRDGLPKIEVTCLFQDKEGFLWIGTKGGLARYDGISFENYTLDNGLQGGVGSIAQLADGSIFVCTYRGYYLITKNKLSPLYTDDRFNFYFTAAVVLNDKVYNVVRSSKSTDVFGAYLTVFDFKSKVFKILDTIRQQFFLKKINEHTIIIYSFNHAGSYTIVTDNNRKIVRSLPFVPFAFSKKMYDGFDILADERGNVYKTILENDSLRFEKIRKLNDAISFGNRNIYLSNDGSLFYVNQHDHLIRNRNGEEERIVAANNFWQMLEDREGNFWVATEDGLFNFFNLQFREYYFGFEKGKPDFIWSMAQTSDSNFWMGSFTSGLWKYNERKNVATHILATNKQGLQQKVTGLTYHPVVRNDTLFYPGGSDYLIISDKVVRLLNEGKYAHLFFYNDPVTVKLLSGANDITYFDGDSMKIFKSGDELGLDNMYVLSLCRDKHKRLWYAASGVLGFIDTNGKVTKFDLKNYGSTLSILCDSRGNLWFAGKNGLWFYDYKKYFRLTHPRLSSQLGALYEYKNKYLIVSSVNGMGILNLEDFYRNNFHARMQVFTYNNGFDVHDFSQNSIYEDRSGYVWINAPNTLIRFQPEKILKKETALNVFIENVQTSSDNVNWSEATDDNLSVQYPVNNLKFSFSSPTVSYAGDVLYRYRLKGFSEWSHAAATPDVSFTNIPDGNYVFEVQSSIDNFHWSETARKNICIKPVWYQTIIFKVVVFIFLTGVIVGAVVSYYRSRRKKLQQSKAITDLKLKNIRNKAIPHFSSNVCSNIDYLIAKGRNEEASAYLADFSRLNNRLLLDAEKTSRSLKEELEFVRLYLRLERLRFGNKLQYEIMLDDAVNDNIQLPVMAVHTYVENAIKHGIMSSKGSGYVQITISAQHKGVLIEVRDNGIGREAAKHSNIFSTGAGLDILQQQINLYNEYNKEKMTQVFTDVKDEYENVAGTNCQLYVPYEYHFLKQDL